MSQQRQRCAFYSARDADATDRTTLDSLGSPKNARTERFVDAASRTHTARLDTICRVQSVDNGRAKTSSFRSSKSVSASARFLQNVVVRLRTLLRGRLQNCTAIFRLVYDVQLIEFGQPLQCFRWPISSG
jgi:hypothetical protein